MKILNPSENINSIVRLIDNAEKFVVMVSPFTNLKGWDNLRNALLKAPSRGVPVSYYVRGGEGRKGLEGLDLTLFEVPMLHAKMFFSEKEAIISSFHLLYNEDINWAWTMDYPVEYNELVKFFEAVIKPHALQ
jgi:phosphatidylserine/phosphatidylglycerophosphate/cardiolipin synthase-like enzyme